MDDTAFLHAIRSKRQRIAEYKSVIISYYDRVTDAYRSEWGDFFHLPVFQGPVARQEAILGVEQLLASQLELCPGARILDVGCGIGGTAIYLAKHYGVHVTGINISPLQIEIARERAAVSDVVARTDFRIGDAMDLQLPEKSFDAVITVEACCHMPHKQRFFTSCARLLRPEGVYVGVDWMQRDGLSEYDEKLLIEPVCRLHALTSLQDITRLRQSLETSGLQIDTIQDLTSRTGLLQSSLPTPLMQQRVSAFGSESMQLPGPEEWLTLGGAAMTWAAQAGAFIVIGWRARKTPERNTTCS